MERWNGMFLLLCDGINISPNSPKFTGGNPNYREQVAKRKEYYGKVFSAFQVTGTPNMAGCA
jgi:hypothetical protein